MEIHYTLNTDDASAFLKHGQKHLPTWVVFLIVPSVALLVAAPQLIIVFRRGAMGGSQWSTVLPLLAPILLFLVAFVFISKFQPRSQAAKVATQPYFIGEQCARLSEEAFHHENESGGSFTRWRFVEQIIDAPEHLFILVAPGQGHIIPKRAFSELSAAEKFLIRAQELHRRAKGAEPIASPIR